MYNHLEDKELLNLFEKKKKRDDVFRFIYQKYSGQVMAYCRNMVRETQAAEDIFQETFVKFYKTADQSKLNISIAAFLIRIAKNLCLDHYKSKSYKLRYDVDNTEFLNSLSNSIDDQKFEDKYELMIKSLDLLSVYDKELIVLRVFQRKNYKEIAEILNTNEANARKKIFRAKRKLKKLVEPYYQLFE